VSGSNEPDIVVRVAVAITLIAIFYLILQVGFGKLMNEWFNGSIPSGLPLP
jgi:hypothetical protein